MENLFGDPVGQEFSPQLLSSSLFFERIVSAIVGSVGLDVKKPRTNPRLFDRNRSFFYQLALVIPGMSPSDAISRRVMREMPNLR